MRARFATLTIILQLLGVSPIMAVEVYHNPIINADYSDPDVCVGASGEDFYMTASSFNCSPGLPILHSKDLVHWTIVGHAVKRLYPLERYASPQHGKGVWAPIIRYNRSTHLYYIYWGDPDVGVFVVTAKDPAGEWSEPALVVEGKGIIDPAVLWDEDGRCYMVNAYAGSRACINSILSIRELTSDGMHQKGEPRIVFDGSSSWNHTCEGPKLYKRDDYYWIFCPAGGVKVGHQLAMRSRSPFGPYEARTVLQRGNTDVNGPHQGALVSLRSGEDWFFHFQDKEAYGRVVWLEPVKWENGWPVIGNNGEPVLSYRMPAVGKDCPKVEYQTSDEFNDGLGLQWQWNANYQENFGQPMANGQMRLFCHRKSAEYANLLEVGNLMLQKTPADNFTVTTKVSLSAREDGQYGGLVCMGIDYIALVLRRVGDEFEIQQITYLDEDKNNDSAKENRIAGEEVVNTICKLRPSSVDGPGFLPRANHCEAYLRLVVEYVGGVKDMEYPTPRGHKTTPAHEARVKMLYSLGGRKFKDTGISFRMCQNKWMGAKIGLMAMEPSTCRNSGWIDIDWFRVECE